MQFLPDPPPALLANITRRTLTGIAPQPIKATIEFVIPDLLPVSVAARTFPAALFVSKNAEVPRRFHR
jgi:hypothetical protein